MNRYYDQLLPLFRQFLLLPNRSNKGRPGLHYLKEVARNTGADSYTAMKRMACNNSSWKAASQSKD